MCIRDSPSSGGTDPSAPRSRPEGPAPMPDLDLLACLGWDDAWSSALTAHLVSSGRRSAAQLAPARVSRADRDSCDVLAPGPDGLRTLTAAWSAPVQRASRIDPTTAPVTGDWVVLATTPDVVARPAVDGVLPRRSAVDGGACHDVG